MPENKSGWYQATQYVPSTNAATEGLLKEHYEFYNPVGELLVSLSAEQVDSLIALATKVKAVKWVNPKAPVLPPRQTTAPASTGVAPPSPTATAPAATPQVTIETQATNKA